MKLSVWFPCVILVVELAVAGASNAHAQTAAALRVSVTSAVPDPTTGTLTISGTNFGARPFVTLDLVPLNLQLALDQRIIAVVPLEMIPPGSYQLTVARGIQPSDAASIEVRIGPADAANSAAGPAPATSGSARPSAAASTPSGTPPLPAPGDTAARVGDRTFTLADVDREWQRTDPAGFLAASRQLYDTRRRVLADLVNNELLTREAARRGIPIDALLADELPKHTIPLPDNALSTLYQSLGDRTRGASLEQMRPALREWLARKVEPDLAKMSYLEELTKVSTRVDTLLTSPKVDVLHSPDDPMLESPGANVELVVFGDFESPAYAQYALALPRVRETFGNRLSIVFKHLPQTSPAAFAAAEAAACAHIQGKFWAFHDRLLSEAGALDAARFKRVASDVGLDRTKFDACVDGEATRDRITAAIDESHRYALTGSPSFLVNGRLAPDPPSFLPPYEFFKRTIEEELARQSREAAPPR